MKSGLEKLSNLNQRVIAGVIGASLVVFGLGYNEWSYFFLFLIICFATLKEFFEIIKVAGIKPNVSYGIICSLFLYTIVFLVEKNLLENKWYFSICPVIFILFLLELFQKNEKPFFNIAFTFLGIIYIGIPFALLHVCVFQESIYNFKIILGILLLLWANDIGGYFAGRFLGKTKLFPRISPKKTWEGSIGGAVLSLTTSIVLSFYFKDFNLISWIILSIIIVVIGSYGDLVESLLKRGFQIKDSSQIIPGHGGFLDRFDGLLLSIPFIAAYLKIFL
jgi:phosphatidate cytidylyltransferase